MQLTELGLNRFCGKETSSDTGSLSMSLNPGSSVPNTGSVEQAGNVLSGTVITNCLEQSSPGPDRIEINSFPTVPDIGIPPAFLKTDCFVAYNANVAAVLINKYGIFADNSYLYNVNISNIFTYYNILQPINYGGSVSASGAGYILPVGWSSSNLGLGTYRVTHNLNTTNYFVNITILKVVSSNPCVAIYNVGVNSFDIEFLQYTFDGLGHFTGVIGVNEDFHFMLQQVPPYIAP